MKAWMKTVAVLCLMGMSAAASAQNTYTLPLVLPADSAGLSSFMRIVNTEEEAGTVQIHAIDDTGEQFGPASLSIGSQAVVNFNSHDLEQGNSAKGLSSGVGNGSGNWRLELTTTLVIEPLAYIRTADGFITAMHDVAPTSGLSLDHYVSFFNPGSNVRQISRLRLVNPGTSAAQVTITGRDDEGDAAPGGTVRLTLPARTSRFLTAQALENGSNGIDGRLGDGAGKWRLSVMSNVRIEVMSILSTPTGHITNLSTVPVRVASLPVDPTDPVDPVDPVDPPPTAGRRFRDCPDCPLMVEVPAGSFMMGSPESEQGHYQDEEPIHQVTIAMPFAVGVYEVTRGEYGRFVSETDRSLGTSCWTYEGGVWAIRPNRDWRNPGFSQTDNHPVTCVYWYDAKAFVAWLSRKTGQEYRLLSESEWEYVARAGTTTTWYWGASETVEVCLHGNLADSDSNLSYSYPCFDGYELTAPVGSYLPNGFGLYDVAGNVREWVEDCWNNSYVGAPVDGSAWVSGDCSRRMLRGGAWFDAPRGLRPAYRRQITTAERQVVGGFRVARTITP